MAGQLQMLRAMTRAFSIVPLMIAVAIVLSEGLPGEPPRLLAVLLPVSGVAAGYLLAEAVGYRPPTEGTDVMAGFRASSLLRAALVEAPFLVAVSASYIVDDSWPVIAGAVAAATGVAATAYPTRRVVLKYDDRLDRAGRQDRIARLIDA